jgi:glycosyltransferase involved in cell wall biosynthesis
MKTDNHYLKHIDNSDISSAEWVTARHVLQSNKVVLFIVAYNAQCFIQSVVERIPEQLISLFSEIFIIDDSSTDLTYKVAAELRGKYPYCNINIYRTPFNRGYGGNQKLGYLYCIENKYDIVILLHGDGQYAPEYIPKILSAFDDETDAVFASRMINKSMALKGGMPFYKWIGNQILTSFENKLLGTKLSEFHTGYRAYKVTALKKIPFVFNSDDFHFDTEIIIQLVATKSKIVEVSIPTYYGKEKCHVNGLLYAKNCIQSILRYHLVNIGLLYSKNFDFALFETENYQFKKSPYSLHQYVLGQNLNNAIVTIELGANQGILSSQIAQRVREHWAIDIFTPKYAGKAKALSVNLNEPFSAILPQNYFDRCIALDVIEHLNDPDHFLAELFQIMKTGSYVYISTANIGYFPMRLLLALGQFNYGKRGILDKSHKRLFTVSNFKRSLQSYGFNIEKVIGFSPPFTDLISDSKIMCLVEKLHAFLSRLYPSLFAYNFLVIARRIDSIDDIFKKTIQPERDTLEA